jgi:hypothetical protein
MVNEQEIKETKKAESLIVISVGQRPAKKRT